MKLREGFSCGDRCRAVVEIEGEYEIIDEPVALPPASELPSISTDQWHAEADGPRIAAEIAARNNELRRIAREAARQRATEKGD